MIVALMTLIRDAASQWSAEAPATHVVHPAVMKLRRTSMRRSKLSQGSHPRLRRGIKMTRVRELVSQVNRSQ